MSTTYDQSLTDFQKRRKARRRPGHVVRLTGVRVPGTSVKCPPEHVSLDWPNLVPTTRTFQSRAYALVKSIFWLANITKTPFHAADPRVVVLDSNGPMGRWRVRLMNPPPLTPYKDGSIAGGADALLKAVCWLCEVAVPVPEPIVLIPIPYPMGQELAPLGVPLTESVFWLCEWTKWAVAKARQESQMCRCGASQAKHGGISGHGPCFDSNCAKFTWVAGE